MRHETRIIIDFKCKWPNKLQSEIKVKISEQHITTFTNTNGYISHLQNHRLDTRPPVKNKTRCSKTKNKARHPKTKTSKKRPRTALSPTLGLEDNISENIKYVVQMSNKPDVNLYSAFS